MAQYYEKTNVISWGDDPEEEQTAPGVPQTTIYTNVFISDYIKQGEIISQKMLRMGSPILFKGGVHQTK